MQTWNKIMWYIIDPSAPQGVKTVEWSNIKEKLIFLGMQIHVIFTNFVPDTMKKDIQRGTKMYKKSKILTRRIEHHFNCDQYLKGWHPNTLGFFLSAVWKPHNCTCSRSYRDVGIWKRGMSWKIYGVRADPFCKNQRSEKQV